jgi:hypothetical protein
MSVQSTIASPLDATADVLRAVGAARRRMRTVSMLRLAAIAAPAGVTIGATLALAGWAPAWTSGALGVLGAAAATAWAAARTPSQAAVARLLDARLGLRDRVAAALQLQPTGGPIAALVARDAAARLAPVRMTALFPLAIGRLPALTIAVAVASMAWLASSDRAGGPAAVPMQSAAGDPAGASAGSPARGGSRGVSPTAPSQSTGSWSTPRAAESPTRNGGSDGRGDATREAFAPAASPLGPRAAPRPAEATPAPSASAPGGSRQAAAAPASAGTTGRTGRGGAGGGAAGKAVRPGAGGAAPGNALAATGGDAAVPAPAASYRAARANAEAALARDVIPPDYRDHVRAYFRAIGPVGPGGTR